MGSTPGPAYDRIGVGYSKVRRPEPSWQRAIDAALAGCATVANVGAGAGSYEPAGRTVAALEPSAVMVAQRPAGAAPAARAVAEALPLVDGALDAALVVLSLHHWSAWRAGLAELRRTSGRQVIVTFDDDVHAGFWLIDEYLPGIMDLDLNLPPSPIAVAEALGGGVVTTLPVPHDCADGILWAGWRRPERYLDPAVLAAASSTAALPAAERDPGIERLRADLASDAWHRRHADLLDQEEIDGGFRLVVAGGSDDSGGREETTP